MINRLFGSLSRKRSKRGKNRNNAYSSLEPRKMLATVNLLSNGVLQIIGENDDNDVVRINGNTQYTGFSVETSIEVNGVEINKETYGPYNYSDILRVHVLGGLGNDKIDNKSHEVGQFNGQIGNDRIYGGYVYDYMTGETGVDTIVGRAGNDHILGGDGDDWLYGSAGHDTIYGGGGGDLLRGGNGNDDLYGEAGVDTVLGEGGKDGVAGGFDGVQDFIDGGAGSNRLLAEGTFDGTNWTLTDNGAQGPNDAFVLFHDTNAATFDPSNGPPATYAAGSWSDDEVLIVDEALKAIHFETTDADLLQLGTNGAGFLTFGRQGVQTGGTGSYTGFNSGNGSMTFTENGFQNHDAIRATVFHEIGHNFDAPGENAFIPAFRAISGWTQTGSNWTPAAGAQFANAFAAVNPFEDFAWSFESYFMDEYFGNPENLNIVPAKIDNVELFIDSLS